jgi:hypothetical protein
MSGSQPVPQRKSAPAGANCALEHEMRVAARKSPVAASIWAPEQVNGRGEREIARIAGAQKGYITREQLLAAGLGRGAISHRLKTGRLQVRLRRRLSVA